MGADGRGAAETGIARLRAAPALAELALPGAHFRDPRHVPTLHKHAGRPLREVRLHVTDRTAFRPVRTTSSACSGAPTDSGTPSMWARIRCRCASGPRGRAAVYCCAPVPTRQEGRIRR
ncbi:hypothetical protein [Streptomyces sp. TR1341]|uniref:hypothetical protein n=1 Tax=Streptomyces sp. TR1341 TaxID=2601266 RepID=UPI001EE3BF3C